MIRGRELSLYEEKCKIRTPHLKNNIIGERKKWHYKQEQLGEYEQEHNNRRQCILNYQASGLKQSKEYSPTQISFQHCAGTANEMIHNTTPRTSAVTLRANKSTLCMKDRKTQCLKY